MAGRYRRPTTPEQQQKAAEARQAKLADLHDGLAEQVSALATGPQWRAWLDTAAKFHNYSFNNTLLILRQKPEATQVAGYNLWHELGRQVVKGEKGIAILAPVTRKVEERDQPEQTRPAEPGQGAAVAADSGDSTATARRVVAFRPAYVWDVSQTSGDPLPDRPRPELLAGQAPDGLWESLAAQCEAAGFTVDRRDIDGAKNGFTDFTTHEVVVRADVEPAQAVKTLAHELGHVLMHDPAGFAEGETRTCRGAGEVEAESMAYLVAAEHGLDTAGYTFAYVAGWAASTGDVDAAVRDSGTRVLKTAHLVLDRIEHDLAGDVDQAPVASTDATVVDDDLVVRTDAAAERTTAIRHGAEKAAQDPEPGFTQRDRLLAANGAAVAFFTDRYASAGSWAPGYLAERLGTAELPGRGIGYAPAGWTNLTDHLHGGGFTDADIVGAGLGTVASTGRVIDRFRDRLMFPIADRTDEGMAVVGFVGRRNPAEDSTADSRNPKYLNTAHTPLYTKGEHLYGLAENAGTLTRGGLAVIVEGPLDALAVDVASRGTMAGVALVGTALTNAHAAQIAAALPAGTPRVVVATDADPAGQAAAGRAYSTLTAYRLDPHGAVLPAGMDPAQTAQQHGPAALVERLASAEPMGRQLVDHALAGHDLTTVEGRVGAARQAAGILYQAVPDTWEREIAAVVARTDVEEYLLREAVVDRIGTYGDALGRVAGRDRRDDLDRGQHVQATPAQLAAMSTGRIGPVRPAQSRPVDTTTRPARALTTSQGRGRH